MAPSTAYNLIHDELILDGSSRFNLATFCSTWMEPEAHKLMAETFDKNMIDKDEYPQTAELEMRCVHMLAELWNAPDADGNYRDFDHWIKRGLHAGRPGAEMALAQAHARRGQGPRAERRPAQPGDGNQHPGLLAQVLPLLGRGGARSCRSKATEVDHRPGARRGRLRREHHRRRLRAGQQPLPATTKTWWRWPRRSTACRRRTGLDIPIHVDGASGGFVAPFLQPELVWDFRLPRVKSINTSGHKYGLVYPGVGWIVWREAADLDEDLIFKVDYLGGSMPTLAINFSRPASQIVAQYYNLIRLGHSGYRAVHEACREVAIELAGKIAELGPFEMLSTGQDLPVMAWKLKEPANWTLYDLSDRLRDRGWQVPAYRMPANREEIVLQRIVVRNGFTHDLAGMLLRDMKRHLEWFASQPGFTPTDGGAGFHH